MAKSDVQAEPPEPSIAGIELGSLSSLFYRGLAVVLGERKLETYQLGKDLESIYPEGVVFHSPGLPRSGYPGLRQAQIPARSILLPPRVAAARQPWAVEYNPFGVDAIDLVSFILPLALLTCS